MMGIVGLLFKNWKLIALLLVVLSITGAFFAAKAHYLNLVEERDQYLVDYTEEVILRKQVEASYEAIKSSHNQTKDNFLSYQGKVMAEAAAAQKNLISVQKDYSKTKVHVRDLKKKLARHDFALLLKIKPKMVERRVNAATKKVFRNIEGITREP